MCMKVQGERYNYCGVVRKPSSKDPRGVEDVERNEDI